MALTYNGVRAFDPDHDRRTLETLGALYEDLGLASTSSVWLAPASLEETSVKLGT